MPLWRGLGQRPIINPPEAHLVLTVTDLQNGEGEPIEAANHAFMDCSFLCDEAVPAASGNKHFHNGIPKGQCPFGEVWSGAPF
ncbi:MAG: hypothetical protein IKG82_10835 [Oscillospiraceae bacterium]|nr:hypothetical protein [Oscillospiraceae bacterium]